MVQASGVSGAVEAEPAEPLFDVVVKVPPNTSLAEVDASARAAGIPAEQVNALMKALRNVPQARIGSGVPRQRAHAARETFTKAGLLVELTPLLGLATQEQSFGDDKTACPACDQRVLLSAHRQCPECGVFVDKVTPEDILRRKLLRQERSKLDFQVARDARNAEQKARDAMEAAMRAKIREELEEEYGLRRRGGLLTSRPVLAGIAVAIMATAFLGGRGSLGNWPWAASGASVAKGGPPGSDPDKVMDSLGPKAEGAQAAASGSAGSASGDADIDDPMIRQAGGERIGGKGLTVEQAVAASQTLARSVGNGTADRALAGSQSGPADASGAPGASDVAGAAAAGAADAAAKGDAPEAAVPPALKTMLALDLTREMAEMGQWSRAQGMVKALRASARTVPDPALAEAARIVDVEVRAWALHGLPPARVREAADALLAEAGGLPAGAAQAQAFGLAGAIVSRHAGLPPEVARAFLQRGADAAKAIPAEAQRQRAVAELSFSAGQALASEALAAARAGAWSKGRALGGQLQSVLAAVADPSVQARLLALDSRVKSQLGQADPARQSLARSLQLVDHVPDLAARALLLQQVARLADPAAAERIDAAATSLQAAATGRAGVERARVLAELAVLQADAGMRRKAGELAAAAVATPGLPEADAVLLHTHLIVHRELAAARLLHQAGQYGEAEAVLRRLGDYLL